MTEPIIADPEDYGSAAGAPPPPVPTPSAAIAPDGTPFGAVMAGASLGAASVLSLGEILTSTQRFLLEALFMAG